MTPFLELIDDYLENRLSINERSSFETHLQADGTLMQSLSERQQLRAHLRRLQLKQNIAAAVADMPVSNPTTSWSKYLMAGALALVTAGAVYYFSSKNTAQNTPKPTEPTPSQQIFVPSSEPRANVNPINKDNNVPSENIAKNTIAERKNTTIQNKNITFSNGELDDLIADVPVGYNSWAENQGEWRGSNDAEQIKTYYTAYSLLKKGDFKKSNELFASLVADTKFKNRRRAEWYLTLGELKLNPSASNVNLNRIANTDGHFFQQKARALKVSLEKK